ERARKVEPAEVVARPVGLVIGGRRVAVLQIGEDRVEAEDPRLGTGLAQHPGREAAEDARFDDDVGSQRPRGDEELERSVEAVTAVLLADGALADIVIEGPY